MRNLLFALLLPLGLSFGASVRAQALWLEAGIGYLETAPQVYEAGPKFGLRATRALGPQDFGPELFVSFAFRDGLVADAGLWVAFAPGGGDPFGLQTYAGAGLSLVRGQFGLALTAGLAFEVQRDVAVTLVYTHRPVFAAQVAQAFDLALGLKFAVDPEAESEAAEGAAN